MSKLFIRILKGVLFENHNHLSQLLFETRVFYFGAKIRTRLWVHQVIGCSTLQQRSIQQENLSPTLFSRGNHSCTDSSEIHIPNTGGVIPVGDSCVFCSRDLERHVAGCAFPTYNCGSAYKRSLPEMKKAYLFLSTADKGIAIIH